MADDEPLSTARGAVALVSDVIRAAGENAQVKEAGANLGQTAVTLTRAINNCLVPLAAVNFAFDKARKYFAGQFQEDFSAKANSIPPENIVEPKASIAGPTLQGLAFAHEEPELKDMYLNLLATSIDGRSANYAHPAFVEVIKQLDGEGASLLRDVLSSEGALPIIRIRRSLSEGGFNPLLNHIVHLTDSPDGEPIENPRIAAIVDNWIRLGLVRVSYDTYFDGEQSYAWAEKRPELIKLKAEAHPEGAVVEFKKGLMEPTDFAKNFAIAIGITQDRGAKPQN